MALVVVTEFKSDYLQGLRVWLHVMSCEKKKKKTQSNSKQTGRGQRKENTLQACAVGGPSVLLLACAVSNGSHHHVDSHTMAAGVLCSRPANLLCEGQSHLGSPVYSCWKS